MSKISRPRNFNARSVGRVLCLTFLLSSTPLANADTWEIEGLEPAGELATAEFEFLKVRRAENAIGDTPQNALDTVASIREELSELNRKIDEGTSAYNIRREAMQDEIAHDENLLAIATKRVAAERAELNQRQDTILAALNRILDNGDATASQLEEMRTRFGGELTEIEDRRATLRQELTNVETALKRRDAQREIELDELRSQIPDASERMSIEERLRLASRIGFEAEEKLSKLRALAHERATTFLEKMLETAPEHLESVTASFKGEEFYSARWVPEGEAEASSEAEQAAAAAILMKEEENLAILENSTRVWRSKVRELAQAIKQESDTATQMLNLIAEENIRTIYINTAVEMGGTIAGALATGGIAAITKFAAETSTFVDGIGKVRRSFAEMPLIDEKSIVKTVGATVAKIINLEAVETLTQADNIYDLGTTITVNQKTGLRSDAALLIAGDMSEMLATKGLEAGVAIATSYLGKVSSKAAESTSSIVRGAGIDFATTGI
ncbi:MAG: hypothetical protein RIG26_07025, partial [Thalassospira sp.]|uniref:hypothetical protein n=1 Tax=Thalassospira sp. TaxID=1912094 RepID=UPI0032EE3773